MEIRFLYKKLWPFLSWPLSLSHSFYLLCLAKGVFSPVPPYRGYFIPSHFFIIIHLSLKIHWAPFSHEHVWHFNQPFGCLKMTSINMTKQEIHYIQYGQRLQQIKNESKKLITWYQRLRTVKLVNKMKLNWGCERSEEKWDLKSYLRIAHSSKKWIYP